MTYHEASEPVCREAQSAISVVITPKEKDLGEFSVRRVLPASLARQVGPFVFFDHMGPATFAPGSGINVRPHPHIGLSTVTYLFEGEILHRDSLGFVQPIRPGAVNLMTAGRGIVHSERTSDDRLAAGQTLHGLQVWMALPDDRQDIEPAFVHYPAECLPVVTEDHLRTTIVIGSWAGVSSDVEVLPETLYLDQVALADTNVLVPDTTEERAVYVIEGAAGIDGCAIEPGSMAVLHPGVGATLNLSAGSRVVTIGGEPMTERHLWWNFVHTSADEIDAAKERWRNGGFETVPGDPEFIPLPG